MFAIRNIDRIDTPALVVYEEIMRENIRLLKKMAGDVSKLRPHVKTNKTPEVCMQMMQEGIVKFKCATIAEAEMLGMIGAPDILLAYQPVGPKIARLLKLVETYPISCFSCLTDNVQSAQAIENTFALSPFVLNVFIDVNIGMNRTGIQPSHALDLAQAILSMKHLHLVGLHGYDGHIHDTDLSLRKQSADASFAELDKAYQTVQVLMDYPLSRVIGGSISLPIHIQRPEVECSPGTFVFWDWGYKHLFPDLPFQQAALLLCRVISVIDDRHICVDLGYKSVASEGALPRIHFLNALEVHPIAHSEEHLVVETPDSRLYPVGTVLYGIPEHICPTIALYEKMQVVCNQKIKTTWNVIARDRCITI
jgi:D-serine deaminase-like pyridoxal phosphate-dependent protein